MTQNDRVLAMLREHPQTTADFCRTDMSREYPRCIWWLRHKGGYEILTERICKGSWRFTLIREPLPVEPNG